MEIPVKVALRVFPLSLQANKGKNFPTAPFVQSMPIESEDFISGSSVIQIANDTFPVTHSLPLHCSQSRVYLQTVYPLITLFMEGFDASVVTFGQQYTGKSYTLFGLEVDGMYGEAQEGIVHYCGREIYNWISNHKERNFKINVGWVEICGNEIRDLLNAGNVPCNDIGDMFHWLQVGLINRNNDADILAHSLFTITLEQQWVTKEGIIQHRLSTASFSDLCRAQRVSVLNNTNRQEESLLKDLGLRALEGIVTTLAEPTLSYRTNGNVEYNQTMLTTLLKDSFGGRAQTLLLLCISPLERDINDTLYNLQFALKVQCIKNYVIMNTFSDNNTLISPKVATGISTNIINTDFGLQFATSQYLKLVLNAEGLFNKLISTNILSDLDKEQIEEWLFLKQECEECLSSSEIIQNKGFQANHEKYEMSEAETCQHNSDNESDLESQRPDIIEKLDSLVIELCLKTDILVRNKYKKFIELQPRAVMKSHENSQKDLKLLIQQPQLDDPQSTSSITCRRRSIQPGTSLSNAEIAMLNRVAQREQTAKILEDFMSDSNDLDSAVCLKTFKNTQLDDIQKSIWKLTTAIEARQRQIKEIEHTILIKHNIITELVKNNDTRNTAKNRFNKKKGKLETEYEKTKKQLSKIIMLGKDKAEIQKLQALNAHIRQRLQDLVSIKHIASENCHKVIKLQQSLQESKKAVDDLQKKMTKEIKHKEQLEMKLKDLKEKDNTKTNSESGMCSDNFHKKYLNEVQARIVHLDHVLKEKSNNMQQFKDGEEKESLRHEIRNLRRTRDHCLEQRCSLDQKLKQEKSLSQCEERKLLECDEAIEAIDAAIEFKNELICGHKSIDISENSRREKGEQMLIERLNKLSLEEMRTLLYKYFTKVIDLRDSSRKLETQLISLEREKETWEWKECILSNAVRQARLEGERNMVLLQRQHETKLALMLRHLAEETSACSSFNDHFVHPITLTSVLPHYNESSDSHSQHSLPTDSHCSHSDFDRSNKPTATLVLPTKTTKSKQNNTPNALAKYKSTQKIKDNEHEVKNKFLSKFQVQTRYEGQSSYTSPEVVKSKKKSLPQDAKIPQENLRCLLSTPISTKVTRQKNKIIIQDSARNSCKEFQLTKPPI